MKAVYCLALICLFSSQNIAQAVRPYGGAHSTSQRHNCLTTEHKAALVKTIKESKLYQKRSVSPPQRRLVTPFLSWPTKHAPTAENQNDKGYYGISNFVDNDLSFPDRVRDYTCGDRTYDTDWGGNHTGVDIFPWPFTWHKMIDEEMLIVAAAEGIVITVEDGNTDRNCGDLSATPPPANSVTISHPNGFYTNYLHFKKNSIKVKLGEFVTAGQTLGVVGSSGNSTGPHLHFEVWDEEFNYIEPFYDETHPECHVHVENSLWLEQQAYKTPSIHKVMTAASVQKFPACIDNIEDEAIFAQNQFSFRDSVLVYLYARDQDTDDNINLKLYDPRGNLFYQFDVNCTTTPSACNYFNSSYWYFPFIFTSNNLCGEYTCTVTMGSDVVSHKFMLEEIPIIEEIIGNHSPLANTIESYSVANTEAGSSYYWFAVGGEVVSGQGTAMVEVQWNNVDSGSICLGLGNAVGCNTGTYCEDVFFNPSATNELAANDIKIYPNPFSHVLHIDADDKLKIQDLTIFDAFGKTVITRQPFSNRINTQSITAGTYIIKMNTDKGVIVRKLLKVY